MVGYTFLACRGGSVKYQSCLKSLWQLLILVTDHEFIHLATGMSVNSLSVSLPGLLVNQTGLSVTSIRLVTNMEFQTVRDDSPTGWEVLQYNQ